MPVVKVRISESQFKRKELEVLTLEVSRGHSVRDVNTRVLDAVTLAALENKATRRSALIYRKGSGEFLASKLAE